MTRRKKPTQADLNAYIDGELSPDRRAAVEEWLTDHPGEAKRIADLRRVGERLRAHYAPVAGEPLPERIWAMLSGEAPRAGPPVWAQAAAAVLLVCAGAAAGFLARDHLAAPDRERAALVAGAVGAHTVYVPEARHPVEVRAEEERHLVTWLTSRLGVPVRPPDLSQWHFRLMGGRLLPNEGTPAAQFMYDDDRGTRLTLYVRRAGRAENVAFQFARHGETMAFYWIEQPLAYAIVAEMPREDLLPIAQAVHDQLR